MYVSASGFELRTGFCIQAMRSLRESGESLRLSSVDTGADLTDRLICLRLYFVDFLSLGFVLLIPCRDFCLLPLSRLTVSSTDVKKVELSLFDEEDRDSDVKELEEDRTLLDDFFDIRWRLFKGV